MLAFLSLLALPFGFGSQFLVSLAILTAMSAFLGQAWNLAGGFGGLTSFGHTVFFGLGAYAAAILATRYGISAWFALPLAFVLGAGIGVLIGFASFRAGLRGSHFALVTLAFAEAFRILATAREFTRGGQGINVPLNLGLARFQFSDRRATYAVIVALLLLATGVAAWFRRYRFGAQLSAVRENEDAAAALGIDIVRTKTAGFALSGGLSALGRVDKARKGDSPDAVLYDSKLIFEREISDGSRPSERRRMGVLRAVRDRTGSFAGASAG